MKRNAIATGAVVLFGLAGQATAQSVNVGLGVGTPPAVPSTCSVEVVGNGAVSLASNPSGGVTASQTKAFTYNIQRTNGDLPGRENIRVIYKVNPQAVADELSPYLDGVTAADIRLNPPPNYPGSSVAGTNSTDGVQTTWLVPLTSALAKVQIGSGINLGALGAAAKLKFLSQSSVDVTINNAFSVSCQIEHADGT